MRILFIGAHPDDIEYGAGGALLRAFGNGDFYTHKVACIVLSKCLNLERNNGIDIELEQFGRFVKKSGGAARIESDLPNTLFPENSTLLRAVLESVRDEFEPDVVFTHWNRDINQDHKTTGEETIRVFRNKTVLFCECLRSCPGFSPNMYLQLKPDLVEQKIALVGNYRTQSNLYYMQPDAIRSWARLRGAEVGFEYAEGFILHRLVMS